jgi:hypothetical protein
MFLQPRPVDGLSFCMKPIKAPLAFYKQHNQNTAGNANAKTQDIDERIAFMPT